MRYLILSLSLLFVVFAHAQTNTDLPASVEANIRKRISPGENPGIVIGIIDKNGPRYYSFGTTSIDGPAVNEHSIFEIGSISKVFTAIILAQQSLEGTLKLTDPAQQYLPENVKMPQRYGTQISLASLSDHTSGLPRLPENLTPANPLNPFADYTPEKMYEFLSGYALTRDIGSAYEYSNLGAGLLGHILARKANGSYESLLMNTIANPLNMTETRVELNQSLRAQMAKGYAGGNEMPYWDLPTLAGAGAIKSSAADMMKFVAANIGLTTTTLLPAMELTHKVRHNMAGEMRVGLGWHIANGKNGDVIWHNGGTGGFRSFVGFVKETSTGVVVLTNSTTSVDDIGFHLLNPDSPLIESPDAVEIPESVLESYTGVYQLAPGFNLTVTREGNRLFAQATNQARFEIFARSSIEFYYKVVQASVTFNLNGSVVGSLTLHQGGQHIPGRKIE